MAAAVVAAGRAWNPRVEDWTADPPAGWRGLDGPGFTLACPTRFVFRTERPASGEAVTTVQPPGETLTALRIAVFTDEVPQISLRGYVSRTLGVPASTQPPRVRLGPLRGEGEAGALASGRFWKAMSLDIPEPGPPLNSGSAYPSGRLRTLIALYEQVPAADRPLYDAMLGSIRLRAATGAGGMGVVP
jgi:hypothetical protein